MEVSWELKMAVKSTRHEYEGRRDNPDVYSLVQFFHVEDDVNIGANSTILCGIRIGKGSTIGAGSVVTKDVPHNCLVYGNTAKVKKYGIL